MSEEIPIGPNRCTYCGGEYGEHDEDCRGKKVGMPDSNPKPLTMEMAAWQARVAEATAELVKKHNLAIEQLTERQLAEAICQALLSGDFIKLVNARTGGQQVIYIPFAREQQLESEIRMMKPVVEAAKALGEYGPDITAFDVDELIALSKLLDKLYKALKAISEPKSE